MGAGTGATVAKTGGTDRAVKGGIGSAALVLPSGHVVGATVAVNAIGGIWDYADGSVVAGPRRTGGGFDDPVEALFRSSAPPASGEHENTSIGVVATDARLSREEANYLARVSHDGLALTIRPCHTIRDGDTMFAMATGGNAGAGGHRGTGRGGCGGYGSRRSSAESGRPPDWVDFRLPPSGPSPSPDIPHFPILGVQVEEMDIVRSTADMIDACRRAARPLGLVPTMGALHAGHLSLVDRSLADNAATAVSIFVNPTQFGADEDLSLYPRDLDGDLELLRQRGAALVFVPDVAEVYPPGFDTWVDVGPVAERLEGAERPGHFRGVATVVAKLFNIVRPDRAYFGQKDGQQTVVVRKLVRDLDMGLEIVVCPTVREEDGLAMSSRNIRLTPEQRRAATVIYRALSRGEELWARGETDARWLTAVVKEVLESEPLLDAIDYVSVADAETLEELAEVPRRAMVSTAVRMGSLRLIDNVMIGAPGR